MPQAHNTKAAELHEAAAKSHRTAAEHHGKKDDVAGANIAPRLESLRRGAQGVGGCA